MAKSISEKPKKKSTERMGKTVVASMNRKAYGDEPTHTAPITIKEATYDFNWYDLNCDRKQARTFLVEYLKSENRLDDLQRVKKYSDGLVRGFVSVGCWIARMRSNGTKFIDEDHFSALFEKCMKRLYDYKDEGYETVVDEDGNETIVQKSAESKKLPPMKRPRTVPYTRTPREQEFDRYLALLNEIADAVDILDVGRPNYKYVVSQRLVDEKIPIEHLEGITKEVLEMEAEAIACLEPDSDYLFRWPENESMMRKKRALIASIIVQLQNHRDTLMRKGKGSRATTDGSVIERKPRKKKPVSIDKLVSRVIFQAKDDLLGLESIDVKRIVGAKELWVYNTKYASLTKYTSLTDAGLSVKGTTLLDYDVNNSVSKKIGRKAKEHTTGVLLSGKVQLRKYMDAINATPSKPNGRINENTILLRAIT